jgi:hypothetical protein
MSGAGRRAVLLWAVVAAVLAGLVPAGAVRAADAGGEPTAERVVVVGVPGLVWADVDRQRTPELWALTGESPVGALSVRSARSTTCVLDGWATLGAGNRARYPGPDEGLPPVPVPQVPLPDEAVPAPEPDQDPAGGVPAGGDPADGAPAGGGADPDVPPSAIDPTLAYCGLQERVADVALVEPEVTVERTAADEGTARFGAEPGALGAVVGCATAFGRAATLAVAAPGVAVTRADTLPPEDARLAEELDRCPLALVSLEQLADAGSPGAGRTDDGTDPGPRAAAVAAVDEQIGRIRAALPADTLLLVAGLSEVNGGRPQLHVGIASGPGFTEPGWLTSASTGRAPFVQVIDLAPTVLGALGLPVPPSMNGQPLQVTGDRPDGVAATVAELVDVNTAATVHHRTVGTFFWFLVGASALLVLAGMVVLGGWRRGRPAVAGGSPRARGLLRAAALAAASLPVATYLAGLVDWQATGAPVAALAVAVAAADLLVAAVAGLGPWRRHLLGPPLAVVVITLATLVADVLTGSTLELDGWLGYDAIVAGRFTGYGNLSFGLLSVSALLVTSAVATRIARRARPERVRRVTVATVVGLGLVSVAVIGAPALGRDFGGVVAALPGFLLLAMLLVRARVTLLRLGLIMGAAVVAVGVVAYLDWLRPAGDRSHLGRFVEQLLTGEAWTVVSRKAQANLDILLGSPLAKMLPVALVAAGWLVRPGGLLRSRRGGAGAARPPAGLPAADAFALRAGLLAGALSLAVGAAVNDSGVALPATAAALLVPLLVWLAAAPAPQGTAAAGGAGGTADAGPVTERGPDADRVTVVPRGSTVRNA